MKDEAKVFGGRVWKRALERFDGWNNPFTGFGTARDKSTYSGFSIGPQLTDEQLDALYHEEDMAARICDVVPDEMLRQGFDVKIESGDMLKTKSSESEKKSVTGEEADLVAAKQMAQDVKDQADQLCVTSKFIEAKTWGRTFGGGALLLGVDDGAVGPGLAEPLNEKNIRSFDHINVVDKRYMMPLDWYTDPTEPKVGTPKTYIISPAMLMGGITASAASSIPGTMVFHESRLVMFGGARTSILRKQQNNGWDVSVLQRVNATLTKFGMSWEALSHILQDAHQGVFKMQGLIDAIAARDTGLLLKRLELLDMSRSAARALMLDAEAEDFSRQNFTWSGIREPYELLMLRLASAARMPVTVLMGQSPAGMNATGESDIRWFYDTINSERESDLRPKLERVLRLIMLSKGGPTGGKEPEDWSVVFPPLWQMTPKEEAEIRKLQSDTDKNYVDMGAVLPEEVALSRFTPDGWSPETTIDLDTRREVLELELERMEEEAENPPELMPPGAPVPPGSDPQAQPPTQDPKADPEAREGD